MEIEYIYPDPDDNRDIEAQIKKMQKENTLGCLIMGLFLLGGLFIFLTLLPVLLVITSEHIGHQIVTGKIVGRDLLKDPGLHRSLFADNFSTVISGLIGSVPTTTYGENIGVMAVTRVYSVRVIAGAAVLSILCSFIGKLSALIGTIPGSVIGGISFLLYGMIGASGIRILVDSHVDFGKSRNLALTSVIFVTGLSGIKVSIGKVELGGMKADYRWKIPLVQCGGKLAEHPSLKPQTAPGNVPGDDKKRQRPCQSCPRGKLPEHFVQGDQQQRGKPQ